MQEFLKKYKAEYGRTPDSMAALGYDAANMLFDAMSRAKSLDGKDLAAAITATKDFKGVTGTITIDEPTAKAQYRLSGDSRRWNPRSRSRPECTEEFE